MAGAGQAKYRPYPAYKPSGVAWLGEIPEGWEVAALKHSVSVPITDGPHETPHFIDEGIPFVSAEAVSSGHIDFNKIRSHISQKDHDRYSQKYLPAFGDIYLVKSGATTGITAIVETDEVFNIWSPLAAIRCNDDMVPKFVLHFLRSAQFQEAIRLYWSFGTQQNIGMKVIENLQTAVPCKQEQTKIVAFLDYETAKIDALIAKQQRLIALLEEKRQAVISHAVTKGLDPTAPLRPSGIDWLGDVPAHWEVKKLKHIASILGRIGFRGYTVNDIVDEGEGAIVLSPSNIKDERFSLDKRSYLSWEKYYESPEIIVKRGDILLVKTGSTFGKSTIVENVDEPMTINPQMALVKVHRRWGEFLSFYLKTAFIKATIAVSNTGSGMPTMTQENIGQFPVLLAPDGETAQIVESLNQRSKVFDILVAKAQSAITLLKERRTALTSAAVTGKIDLRGWQAPAEASAQDSIQDEKALA